MTSHANQEQRASSTATEERNEQTRTGTQGRSRRAAGTQQRKRRNDYGSFKASERDLELLAFIGEQYAVTLPQLAHLIGRLPEAARSLRDRWKRAGWAASGKLVTQAPPFVWLTGRGAEAVQSPFRAWRPNHGLALHIQAVTDVRIHLERDLRIVPPTADHVLAVHHLLPARYRLPLLVLDATGMRLGELEQLTWGDIDEPRNRWRISQTVSKTSRARWVNVPPVIFEAVLALTAREDRTPGQRVFQGFGGDRFRTAVTRATTAAGVPAFNPHALRHRRISLLHLAGVPAARIGEHVGQRDLKVTLNTYTHVIADEAELDYTELLKRARNTR